jgi:hypothetical protein
MSHSESSHLPPGVHLPRPTVWPLALAWGISLILAGVVIHLGFTVFGIVVVVLAIRGWIREILDE